MFQFASARRFGLALLLVDHVRIQCASLGQFLPSDSAGDWRHGVRRAASPSDRGGAIAPPETLGAQAWAILEGGGGVRADPVQPTRTAKKVPAEGPKVAGLAAL